MGLQEKHEVTPLQQALLRPMRANTVEKEEEDAMIMMLTTPVKKQGRLMACPPAPKKVRPPPLTCRAEGLEFFSVPEDLESLFVRRQMEKAK